MPTSCRERPSDEAGFTLAEMLLVVAITALAAGLVVGRGLPGQHRIDRAAVESFVRSVRADAMRRDRQLAITPGPDGHSLAAGGKALALPLDHQIRITNSMGEAEVSFGPDGSSEGGVLRIRSPGREDSIVIQPVSGALQP